MSSSVGELARARAPLLTPLAAAFTLALLLGLQPVTTDLFAPAMPLLARSLGAAMADVQLTMAAAILSFGLAQLVWGPVADRVGRRPVLLAGLLMFTLASVGAALAQRIETVVAWRVLQGAGMSAAVMCARAMLRDLYEPHEGARVMAQALTGLGLIAIVAPVAGGLVAAWAGWRGTMTLTGLCGLALMAFVVWRVPETARSLQATATQPGALARQWRLTLAHPMFRAWTALVSCSYGGLFVMLAGSGFVYIGVFGLAPWQFGAVMASCSVAYIGGTLLCRRWLPRHGLAGSVMRAAGFTAASAASLLGLWFAGVESLWALLLPQWLYCLGHGVHQPCGQAGAVAAFPRAAGQASALAGCVLALVAFGVGLWLGQALAQPVRALVLGVGLGALTTCAVAWSLVRRDGEPPEAGAAP